MGHIVGSILHGAYGDYYEQLVCLRHYALTHPEIELKLYADRQSRMEVFQALDLSFASDFQMWTQIKAESNIDEFFQFQVLDQEFGHEVLSHLPDQILAKMDRVRNVLPWVYLRTHGLTSPPEQYQLRLNIEGKEQLRKVGDACGVNDLVFGKPTICFLWRYRVRGSGSISSVGQKSEESLAKSYSELFRKFIADFDCNFLVCGMNVLTTGSNRELTDNKFPSFGLDLPATHVTYLKGLHWLLELEIASGATVCCGNASGFTEALWMKRTGRTILMDAPPHYLAKALYRRMPMFGLNNPFNVALAMPGLSPATYERKIRALLRASRQ